MSAVEPSQPERVIYVREPREPREPREKSFKLDLDSLILPGVIIGGLVAIAIYKDDIAEFIEKLPGIPIPKPNGNGNGNGNGEPQPNPTPGQSGTQWYKANGSTTTLPAGRQDGSSNRWNKNVNGWQNGFEIMGYLTITGMKADSHIGAKMGGPNHSGSCAHKEGGSCCCWWDGGLRRNGDSYLEIEYPHPSNKGEKKFTNMGRNIDAGMLGIRWLNMKEGNGRRNMFWVDTSGKANNHQWRLMYDVLDTGQFMPTSYYSKVPSSDMELEIRISDVPANNIKWSTGPIARQITGSSNFAYAYLTGFDRITLG